MHNENTQIKRMWINQPSTQQPLHKYHGLNVLAIVDINSPTLRIYPTKGDVVSMEVPWLSLSEGWI